MTGGHLSRQAPAFGLRQARTERGFIRDVRDT
jgi:hypothetical protein